MTPSTNSTTCCGQQAFTEIKMLWKASIPAQSTEGKIPWTSPARLTLTSDETVLYLAYGSNLCAKTFEGARGIKPLSAVNVHVPSLTLTFDLAGVPYSEPCFANSRYSRPLPPPSSTLPSSKPYQDADYHKDRWHKGLVGVVYEVTPEDYRTIIATEGGGASYQDVIVPCYVLPPGTKTISAPPSGSPFSAHTLMRPPPTSKTSLQTSDSVIRPDPSYAQPSARYLNLITSGGEEHSLPEEYMAYLYSIRPYTITSARQRAGQAIIIAVWMPIFLFLFGLGKVFADDEGKIPGWLASITGLVFQGVWVTYDRVLEKTFGDGERTMGDNADEESGGWSCEKSNGRWKKSESLK